MKDALQSEEVYEYVEPNLKTTNNICFFLFYFCKIITSKIILFKNVFVPPEIHNLI